MRYSTLTTAELNKSYEEKLTFNWGQAIGKQDII